MPNDNAYKKICELSGALCIGREIESKWVEKGSEKIRLLCIEKECDSETKKKQYYLKKICMKVSQQRK